MLETSFAQFQADRAVVGLATELRRVEEALDGYRDSMQCHLGDYVEYAQLRESLSRREKDISRRAAAERRDAAEESWLGLRQGDVFMIPSGRRAGPAVVLDQRRLRSPREAARPMVLTADGQVRRMSVADTSQPVEAFTRITVPKGFVARDHRARRDLLDALHVGRRRRAVRPAQAPGGRHRGRRDRPPAVAAAGRIRATAATTARCTPGGPSATTAPIGMRATSSAASRAAPTRSPAGSTRCARC